MKTTSALIERLIRLANGDSMPASVLKGEWFECMISDGILVATTKGSRKSYRARDEQSLRNYLATHYDIRNLEAYLSLLKKENASRAEQVKITGNSKVRQQRTFRGFLVNCYDSISVTLAGEHIELLPEDGTFTFIYDFNDFLIPEDVVIIGVENPENFRYIRKQKWLFGTCLSAGTKILFVSRYPQEQSRDLLEWLLSIPNPYIHFGDLDLAGVHIFLSEYYRYLGERASFLIPKDYEARISLGSRERYDNQYGKFGQMEVPDIRLLSLVECIHRLHRGYDQEGFVMEKDIKISEYVAKDFV